MACNGTGGSPSRRSLLGANLWSTEKNGKLGSTRVVRPLAARTLYLAQAAAPFFYVVFSIAITPASLLSIKSAASISRPLCAFDSTITSELLAIRRGLSSSLSSKAADWIPPHSVNAVRYTLSSKNFVKQGLFEREMDIAGTRFQFDAAVRGELILV